MYVNVPPTREAGYLFVAILLVLGLVLYNALAMWVVLNYPLQNLVPPVSFLECCAMGLFFNMIRKMDHDSMGKELDPKELRKRGKNLLARGTFVIVLALIINLGV